MKSALLLLIGSSASAVAAVQTSGNYTVLSDVFDGGGARSTSGAYANDGSVGGFGGLVSSPASQETVRIGYAGQLYEVTAFSLTAASTNLNEGTSVPLYAFQFLDDGTVSPANTFAQWAFSGPISDVNVAGIVTAANVNQNTPAVVSANLEGRSASLSLLVLNTDVSPGFNQVSAQYLGGNQMRLSFAGFAGNKYALDRAYNLAPPVGWIPQLTNIADANGLLILTNLANPMTNNFWRIRSVP
jgi:hypothetical protein